MLDKAPSPQAKAGEPEIQKRVEVLSARRPLQNPQIARKKTEKLTRKYRTNSEIVNCCEALLSRPNKEVFHVDPVTNTVLGNLGRAPARLASASWAHRLLENTAFALNVLLSLLLSSFQLRIGSGSKEASGASAADKSFDKMNAFYKGTSLFSDAKFSARGLNAGYGRGTASAVRVTLGLMLKLLLAFQLVLELGSKSGGGCCRALHLLLALGCLVWAEAALHRAKAELDRFLRLDVNFVESRAFISEKQDFLERFPDSGDQRSQAERLKLQLADELSVMRIQGNVKKEFVLGYFAKRAKSLRLAQGGGGRAREAALKVFTGYRNEDMMKRHAGSGEFVYQTRDSGRQDRGFPLGKEANFRRL